MSTATSVSPNRPLSKQERSAIFSEYNRLRGRGNVEQERLNRALGIVQKGNLDRYNTTIDSCDCPDSQIRGVICKHRAALRMHQMAKKAQREEEGPGETPKQSIDEINDLLFG